jgi:putative ABC transport system permease protein
MFVERLFEIFTLGVKNLLRNKLRSFLTMLGMIFGVGSVITMLSVGAGARHAILERIQQLGVTNIIINSVKPPEELRADSTGDNWVDVFGLKFSDADGIEATIPTIDGLLRVNKVRERVWYGSKRVDCSILGVQPGHFEMFRIEVTRGRGLEPFDFATSAKVCVLRRSLVRQLETVEDPIGMWLKLGDDPFQVVGILDDEQFHSHTRKALAIDGREQEVYIPYTTSMSSFGTMTIVERTGQQEYSQTDLDQIIVSTDSAEDVFGTSEMLSTYLDHFHEKRDYEIIVPLELLQQSEETQRVFNVVMILIASISLLVGGIGIANIMLATITERTKEIGIRRALGATRRDIVIQFLTETTAIAATGGLLGCLFGVAGILGIVEFTEWKAIIAPDYVLVSLVISCTVGIVFGLYPARRASRMDPITALRYE